MCLFGRARPAWEEEVTFSNRRHPRHRTRVTETTVRSHRSHSHSRQRSPSPRPVQYIQAPSPSPPPPPPMIHKPSPPPPIILAPSPPPPPMKVELVSVEEDTVRHIHTSKKSRSHAPSSHGGSSRGGEEVYIEREREIQRRRPSPPQMEEQYDTYRYVPGVAPAPMVDDRRRSRGDVYDSPRVSTNRVVERERVVVDDGSSRGGEGRREYYRRG